MGLSRFEVIKVFAGYAAGGLTQPTENKTYSKKVGWDKRSVPNMFVKEH